MVKSLAETWGLSFEGAAWHAKNCDIIRPEQADELVQEIRKPSLDLHAFEHEPDFYPPSLSHPELSSEAAALWQGWATLVVLDALESNTLSAGRVRELLTWG